VFSDYTFAQKVRDRVRDIIEPFMRNPNQILRQTDIENMLINITREDLEALKYTVANVYR
jgi:5,10-methenyltetrahydromethanopterin hydrogenase